MAFDQVMSSYVGHGTHAARPASPNVASGVSPVYYETDTTNTFLWTGSAWTQINGGGGAATLSVASKTTTYTITSSDDVILGDATSAGFTVSLPTAVGWTKRITIKKIDSSTNAVTVGTTGGETIDGNSTRLLKAQLSSVTLISDNANWRVTEEELPLTSKGDLLAGLASNDLQRLAVGSDGLVLTAASGQATGLQWAAPNLNSAAAFLTSAVTMTSIDTYYDGPSLSLAAGTWIVAATVAITNNSNAFTATARIWDGTTVYGEGCAANQPQFGEAQITVPARIVLGSPATIKVSVASHHSNSSIAVTAINNGTTNKLTQITASQAA